MTKSATHPPAGEPAAVQEAAADPDAPVPFFSQADTFRELWPSIAEHAGQVMDRGKYSHGRKVAELERALAAYTGARHAFGVNNGTDALVLLLRAAGVRRGDEVLVPAFTFAATATAVALAGARPVFTDIDPVSYAMDPDSLASAVTEKSVAVMPAHMFAQMADMTAIGDIAARHGLTVLEDSAEGIGMRQGGRHAGLLGRGGVLSFFPSKTLGAVGDGGMILTDDDAVAEQATTLRHHGRMGKTIDHIAGISNLSGVSGTNSKMDDIQAAVLMAKLDRLDADIERRRQLAAAYTERLGDIEGVTRLPTTVDHPTGSDHVFYVYQIEVDRRDELVEALNKRGIGTETYYPIPLHLQPCFADHGHKTGDFPNAEAACQRSVALPFYPDLSEHAMDRVVAAVRDFFTGRTS